MSTPGVLAAERRLHNFLLLLECTVCKEAGHVDRLCPRCSNPICSACLSRLPSTSSPPFSVSCPSCRNRCTRDAFLVNAFGERIARTLSGESNDSDSAIRDFFVRLQAQAGSSSAPPTTSAADSIATASTSGDVSSSQILDRYVPHRRIISREICHNGSILGPSTQCGQLSFSVSVRAPIPQPVPPPPAPSQPASAGVPVHPITPLMISTSTGGGSAEVSTSIPVAVPAPVVRYVTLNGPPREQHRLNEATASTTIPSNEPMPSARNYISLDNSYPIASSSSFIDSIMAGGPPHPPAPASPASSSPAAAAGRSENSPAPAAVNPIPENDASDGPTPVGPLIDLPTLDAPPSSAVPAGDHYLLLNSNSTRVFPPLQNAQSINGDVNLRTTVPVTVPHLIPSPNVTATIVEPPLPISLDPNLETRDVYVLAEVERVGTGSAIPCFINYRTQTSWMVYSLGGRRDGCAVSMCDFSRYQPHWSRYCPPPAWRRNVLRLQEPHACGATLQINEKIIIAGGEDARGTQVVKTTEQLDIDPLRLLPGYSPELCCPRADFGFLSSRGKLVAVGGRQSLWDAAVSRRIRCTNSIETFNGILWQLIPLSMHLPRFGHSCIQHGDRILAFGGIDSHGKTHCTLEALDLTHNKRMLRKIDIPNRTDAAEYGMSMCGVAGFPGDAEPEAQTSVLFVGGYGSDGRYCSTVCCLDTRVSTLVRLAPLSSPRARCSLIPLPQRSFEFLVFGGCSANEDCIQTVEYIDTRYDIRGNITP